MSYLYRLLSIIVLEIVNMYIYDNEKCRSGCNPLLKQRDLQPAPTIPCLFQIEYAQQTMSLCLFRTALNTQ
jgi:hypothetical protein